MRPDIFHRSSTPTGMFGRSADPKSWFSDWFQTTVDFLQQLITAIPKRFTSKNPNYPVKANLPTRVDGSILTAVKRVSYIPVVKYLPERKPKF